MNQPTRWQLPRGVSSGVWEYAHNENLVQNYDQSLAGSSLFSLDQAWLLEQVSTGQRVLDLGCGTGRHWLTLLHQRRCEVLGLDLSPAMLDHAARQLRAAGFAPALIQANLVELECLRPERFDVCLCLFSTLGMIVGRENRQTVLKHAHRILAPGGKLLLHVHNLWFNLWNAPGRTWLVCDLARWLLGRPEAGDRAMPVHQGVSNLSLHLFTRRELRSQLCTAGFEKIRIDPISLSLDGKLALASLLPGLRAYGYFVRAEKAGGLGNPADFDH